MKVIKSSIDLQNWTLPHICANCKSEVEIETTDIYYDYDINGKHWVITCCLCDYKSRLDDSEVPEIVKTDVKKNRVIYTPPFEK